MPGIPRSERFPLSMQVYSRRELWRRTPLIQGPLIAVGAYASSVRSVVSAECVCLKGGGGMPGDPSAVHLVTLSYCLCVCVCVCVCSKGSEYIFTPSTIPSPHVMRICICYDWSQSRNTRLWHWLSHAYAHSNYFFELCIFFRPPKYPRVLLAGLAVGVSVSFWVLSCPRHSMGSSSLFS
jgi:hypothetical protein